MEELDPERLVLPALLARRGQTLKLAA